LMKGQESLLHYRGFNLDIRKTLMFSFPLAPCEALLLSGLVGNLSPEQTHKFPFVRTDYVGFCILLKGD
jgi:hypothetical protein